MKTGERKMARKRRKEKEIKKEREGKRGCKKEREKKIEMQTEKRTICDSVERSETEVMLALPYLSSPSITFQSLTRLLETTTNNQVTVAVSVNALFLLA